MDTVGGVLRVFNDILPSEVGAGKGKMKMTALLPEIEEPGLHQATTPLGTHGGYVWLVQSDLSVTCQSSFQISLQFHGFCQD